MAELRLRDVTRRFGDIVAVEDLTLHIPDGTLACLLGPSGCGKTTTLRMIAGLEVPDAGTIELGGVDITHLEPRHRHVGMMFQGYALYPHLSVHANIGYPLKVRGADKAERDHRVREVARLVGVEALLERAVSEISGGQAQRVALARAIVQRPRLFLLDEPISALDAAVRSRMRGEIKRLQRTIETTTVIVSHDQLDALSMADLLVVLRDGVVQQVGTPTQLHDTPATAWVGGFIGEPQMNLLPATLESRDGIIGVSVLGRWLALPADRRRAVASSRAPEVTLGVRPVAVQLHPIATAERIPARVFAVQPQGTRTLYELAVGDILLRAETITDIGFDLDAMAWLEIDPQALHLFAADDTAARIA